MYPVVWCLSHAWIPELARVHRQPFFLLSLSMEPYPALLVRHRAVILQYVVVVV